MTKDGRTSRKEHSGTVNFASGESGSTKDLIDIDSDKNFSISDIVVTYSTSGTNDTYVALYDDPAGTGSGNTTKEVSRYQITPGDQLVLAHISREDIEDDVVAYVDNNDDDVSIVIGGHIIGG